MAVRPFNGRFLQAAMSAALLLWAAGCGTTTVQEINKAAVALRTSYSDEPSRLLAQKSLDLLGEQRGNYRVGAEDVLQIDIFELEIKNEIFTAAARVAESGVVSLPVLGATQVSGLTVEQVQELLESTLKGRGILLSPHVSVMVKEFRSKRVAVVGAVHEPGVYTLRQNVTTLLEVLALAGGTTEKAGQLLYVIRASPPAPSGGPAPAKEVISVDLFELLEAGALELNVVLQNGNVVNVPEAQKFFVVGYVKEPGGFPLTRPTTVLEGIALAHGLLEREASPTMCTLKRRQAQGEELIALDLVAISRGQAPNLYLMPDDVIDVPQTSGRWLALGIYDTVKAMFNVGYAIH